MPKVSIAGSSTFSSRRTSAAWRSPAASPATRASFIGVNAAETDTSPRPARYRRRKVNRRPEGRSGSVPPASLSRAARRIRPWPRRRGTSARCDYGADSFFSSLRDVEGVEHEKQVHQAGRDGEGRTMLEGDRGDVAVYSHSCRDPVDHAGTERTEGGQQPQNRTTAVAQRVEIAVDGDANDE